MSRFAQSLGIWFTLGLLCGCAHGPRPGASPAAVEQIDQNGVLRGQILPARGLQAPAQGLLQLQLVPRFNPSPQALVSARIAFSAAPPWPFELGFPRAMISDPTLYRLDVALFDAEGHLRLVSYGEHPVNLSADAEPTRIEMMALDHEHPNLVELDCEAQTVTLQFNEADLQLSLDGVPYRLRRAHSALGRRYVGADAELWIQAEGARLQLGARTLSCAVVRPAEH
jgi:hypothetical protein